MKRPRAVFLFLLLTAVLALPQQTPPDWAKREFNAPADKVFAAALKSIQQQKHEIKKTDENAHRVEFHVGITAWSWGYNMVLTVTPIDAEHSKVLTGISKSGGDVFSWGSGKKEVNKIYGGIAAELANQPKSQPSTEAKPKSGN